MVHGMCRARTPIHTNANQFMNPRVKVQRIQPEWRHHQRYFVFGRAAGTGASTTATALACGLSCCTSRTADAGWPFWHSP